MERITGVEPVQLPWQGSILPLNYIRMDYESWIRTNARVFPYLLPPPARFRFSLPLLLIS